MRKTISLLLLSLVAACGDNKNNNQQQPDAFVFHPDAAGSADGAIDGAIDGSNIDASVDSTTTPTVSKVWVVGDWNVNGTQIAGRFLSTDTLPFGNGTLTGTVAPGGTSVLASGGSATQFVFDISADGTKTAFVADLTTAGTFDIYLADADGANATKLVAGATGIDFTSLQFSPDGSKLAYVSDTATTDNVFDMFVVATTAGSQPVQVSPARVGTPTGLNVFTQFSWSADSKFLGFTGGLTVKTISEAFVVDTTAATPTAVKVLASTDVTAPSVGTRGIIQWDNTDTAYFRASVDGTAQFKLFKATTDGTRTDLTATLPARGDTTTPDIGALGIDRTGTLLVVSADSPTATDYDIYSVPLANPTATKLTNLTAIGHANFNLPLFFSPDNKSIAYIADFTTSGVNEPFVTKLDGSDTHRLFPITVTNADTEWLQWSVDGTQVYAQGDLEVNNDTKLYVLDPTKTDQALTTAINVPTSGDVQNVLVRP